MRFFILAEDDVWLGIIPVAILVDSRKRGQKAWISLTWIRKVYVSVLVCLSDLHR